MPQSIEQLNESLLEPFMAMGRQAWDYPQNKAFFQWRYLHAPNQMTFLAMRDGQCLGSIVGQRAHYLINGEKRPCILPVDWYASPDAPGMVGISLWKKLQGLEEPLITLGGSQQTRIIIPRLGSKKIFEAEKLILNTSNAVIRRRYQNSWLLKPALFSFSVFAKLIYKTKRRYQDPKLTALPTSLYSSYLDELYKIPSQYDFVRLMDTQTLQWLSRAPNEAGIFIPIFLFDRQNVAAWVLGRVFWYNGGLHARIVDLYVPGAELQIYRVLISEITAVLAGFGVDDIEAVVSCPRARRAFRDHHFRSWGQTPVFIRPAGTTLGDEYNTLITLTSSDGLVLPIAGRS